MPNNFPNVNELKNRVIDGLAGAAIPCENPKKLTAEEFRNGLKLQANIIAEKIHSLFTSCLDSITEGFPKEENVDPYDDNVSVGDINRMRQDCLSYHIKVVAQKDKEISKLDKMINCLHADSEIDDLRGRLEEKDKEIERLRGVLREVYQLAEKCNDKIYIKIIEQAL